MEKRGGMREEGALFNFGFLFGGYEIILREINKFMLHS
jgi:hypothetical protein